LDVKQWGSILVAVLMVGSIVGFTAFYNFPDQDQGNNDEEPDKTPTSIDFIAENVDATVFELLPSVKLQAETAETSIIEVNSQVSEVEGITRVNGRFEASSYTVLGTGFAYLVDISFSPDLNSGYIIEKLEKETSLEQISGYIFASLELPETISMRSTDTALDMAREHTFSRNVTDSLIGLDALKGDSLKATVTATFVGDDALNVMAFEEENLTAAPVDKNQAIEADINALESTLLFDGQAPYSAIAGLENLEADINALEEVSGSSVFVSAVSPKFSIIAGDGLIVGDQNFLELESFLNNLEAETVSIENNPLSASLLFAEAIPDQNFLEKLSSVEAKLTELGIDANVEEEKGFLSGQVSLSSWDLNLFSGDLNLFSGDLNLFFADLNLVFVDLNLLSVDSNMVSAGITALLGPGTTDLKFFQPGELSLREIIEEDSGKVHKVKSGKVSALLLPGHSIGGTAFVELDYALVRGILDSAWATEKAG